MLRSVDEKYVSPAEAFLSMTVGYLVREREKGKTEYIPISEPFTVDVLQPAFNKARQDWQASKHYQELLSTLKSHNNPALHISQVIAFACSSLTYSDKIKDRSILQHSLILLLRDVFSTNESTPGSEIRCFAQDPFYKESDEAVLQREGITVLDDPRAFLRVDESSVIISFGADIPVKQIIADIARPAVIIWGKGPLEEYPDGCPGALWLVFRLWVP
jgi:hypothetical protein